MRSPRFAALALVATLLLAGCTGPDPDPSGSSGAGDQPLDSAIVPGGGTVAPVDMASVEAPTWAVGDAWTVKSHGFGDDETSTLVVTSAAGDTYTLESTSGTTASFDAIFDVSYIGTIRARDLAGAQQGNAVQFFDFPLTDGKTWTTTWDGFEVALKATLAGTKYTIEGTANGEPYVAYDYTPELRWWSHIMFIPDEFGFEVLRVDTGWTGDVATAVAKQVYESGPAAPVASPATGAFTIDEGQTTAIVTAFGGGKAWTWSFALVDPSGMPYATTDIETFRAADVAADGEYVFYTAEIPPTPGEWHIGAPAFHDPEGAFFVNVYQVAVSSRPIL